ncbi:hypothetical protein ABZ471_39115 [Streptomyces sp. NPDC005728]|uniref:hypothetical protein n=1 Tax=Streptomyces sp. NPDC005728 TaxID=3157054 RepID=UPI0033CBC99C
MGLHQAHEQHLSELTLAALRYAYDPTFPDSAGARGAEFLYRVGVGDLKRWAHNRPHNAVDTTDLT